jgi:glyoxylase-like metal-dependent hydrolase (beta-lactamase superfamily II)
MHLASVTRACRGPPGAGTFPDKMYSCLADLKAEGKEDIACFLGHGRAFIVSKPELFEQEIMPRYFESINKWNR